MKTTKALSRCNLLAATMLASASVTLPAATNTKPIDQKKISLNNKEIYQLFDRNNSVILMVDFQTGIGSISKSQPIKEVLDNASKMLILAKINIPVFFTSSEETLPRKGKFYTQLTTILPEAYAKRVKRTGTVDAMRTQEVVNNVMETNCKNIVIAGISTEECVSLPALTAINIGYNVKVISDACCSYSTFTDNIQFNRMMSYGVDVTTIRQFIADMLEDWSSKESTEYTNLTKKYNVA